MQEKAGQFRSAAFGGFHRQDVLHYIEQLTREHQANCERLERELTAQPDSRRRSGCARQRPRQQKRKKPRQTWKTRWQPPRKNWRRPPLP